MKYLGVDYGEKRIGLALGDGQTKIATPYGVVNSVDGIIRAVSLEQVDEIVVGIPYRLDPTKESRTKKEAERFALALGELTGKKIHLADETLTSKAADALAGGKKDKAPRDSIAAMLILQDFLNLLE